MKKWICICVMSIGLFGTSYSQRRNPALPSMSEPTYPRVLDNEALTFLQSFQRTVAYLANKNNNYNERVLFAKSFANVFKQGATIEVLNRRGTIKHTLDPLAYFMRVINLNYDRVEYRYKIIKRTKVVQEGTNDWRIQYKFGVHFEGTKNGRTVLDDYTIRLGDMHFFFTPATKTWTKLFGNVKAIYQTNN